MLVLTGANVERLSDMNRLILEVERAFGLYDRGLAYMPPRLYVDIPEAGGDFRAMPARVDQSVGLKWISCHPGNPKAHDLPTVMALFILSDTQTGVPLALMDGTVLTRLRTAAVTAVATRFLARSDASTVGIIGCGAQARAHVEALECLGRFREYRLYDEQPDRSGDLAQSIGPRSSVVSIEAAAGSDVVITLTPSRRPIVLSEWIRPGSHINAIGADAPGKQELDPDILGQARVFVDDLEQAVNSGEVNVPIRTGIYSREQLAGSLGQVVAGRVTGRSNAGEITVFDSTGLAIQDVAAAVLIYREALRLSVGVRMDMGGT